MQFSISADLSLMVQEHNKNLPYQKDDSLHVFFEHLPCSKSQLLIKRCLGRHVEYARNMGCKKNCPFVFTSFTGWSSERCPGIGCLSRGDREIGVLRKVEPPTRPRLECLRETGLILRCDRKVGNPFQTKQGSRPSRPDQEGRKGSEEGVPENLRVPLTSDSDRKVPADLGQESQASS